MSKIISEIGIHISGKDIIEKLINIKKKKYNAVQMFITKEIKSNYKKIKDTAKKLNINIVIHASYTINIANDWSDTNNKFEELKFIEEIEYSNKVGADAIIIHTGKQLNKNLEVALNNMYMNLINIHNLTKKYSKTKIAIETPAGQGTELLSNLNDYFDFLNKLIKHKNKNLADRFKSCIDTCHIFASGFDFRTDKKLKLLENKINNTIGFNNIIAVHINDSKNKLNSHVDRHEVIGKGEIGFDALYSFIQLFYKHNIIIILETPDID
jgi:deoxyribonuclease-4